MKPYNFESLINIILLSLVLGWIAALVLGCATTPAPVQHDYCPETQFVVHTPEDWSELDQANLELARRGCARRYPNSPCLKKFIRWEQLRYSAVCGGENK